MNQLDVYVKKATGMPVLFFGECKYRAGKVDASVMNGIIAGMTKKWVWKVLMVFCERLTEFQTWQHPSIRCVKIDCASSGMVMADPDEEPTMSVSDETAEAMATWVHYGEAPSQLVIVIETGEHTGV